MFSISCWAVANQHSRIYYEAALVEIDQESPSTQHLKRTMSTESVIRAIASSSAYRILYRPYIETEIGTPGVSSQVASESFPVLVQSISEAGSTVKSVMGSIDEGYTLTITPSRSDSEVVTTIRLEHSVKFDNQAVSLRQVVGENVMRVGDYQVLTWPNNGKTYALIVRLAKVD